MHTAQLATNAVAAAAVTATALFGAITPLGAGSANAAPAAVADGSVDTGSSVPWALFCGATPTCGPDNAGSVGTLYNLFTGSGTVSATSAPTDSGSAVDPQTGSAAFADPDGTAGSGSAATAVCAVLSLSELGRYFCRASPEGDVSAVG